MSRLASAKTVARTVGAALLAFVACTEFALYALRPSAPLWTYPHTNAELVVACLFGGVCAALLAWRVARGASVAEELKRVEHTVTSGDHLG
jgi:hypothetical protein